MASDSDAAATPPPALALIAVMGLPGSGKSTLCRMLRRSSAAGANSVTRHLEFDEFVPDSALIAEAASAQSGWKLARDGLLRSLDGQLCQLRPGLGATNHGRVMYFSAAADEAAGSQSQQPGADPLAGLAEALLANRARPPRRVVLLLDDNFYYASMRHAVFQLARFYNCGYGTVYMKASTGQLKLINSLREKPVPDGVIGRMSQRLEAPSPDRNPWEKFSCVLNECDIGFLDDVGHYSDNSVNGRLHTLIQDCLANPFEPIDLEEAARQADAARETCSLSLLHQADLRLRAIVSDWLGARQDAAELGKAAANSKRALLNALRDGKLKVPARLNSYSPDMRDALDAFLHDNINLPS